MLDVSTVKVGDLIAELEKKLTTIDLMAYGAATWDWHRLHYDLDYAGTMGLSNVVLDGQEFGALFARAAMDWAGQSAFLTRLGFNMRSMVFAGETLLVTGQVNEVRGQLALLTQHITSAGRLVAEASAEVRFPKPGLGQGQSE